MDHFMIAGCSLIVAVETLADDAGVGVDPRKDCRPVCQLQRGAGSRFGKRRTKGDGLDGDDFCFKKFHLLNGP